MIDVEAAVFNRVAEKFDIAYPNGTRVSEPIDAPASFPCMSLVEADNATYTGSLDAEMMEHDAWLMYELNVYSNLASGAKQQCKEIIALVDDELLAMGFTRTFCHQTKNADTKIYRMTARYRAIISEELRIYRK
jgi:hypothetical protein